MSNADMIRVDWLRALREAKNGAELSGKIDFGFSTQDLLVLICFYEADFYREKILDLFEDCNMHTLNGVLKDGDFDFARSLVIV